MSEKRLAIDELIQKVQALQSKGKRVVQSHGVFDLIHPGIITHLTKAKKQGDILVVTVIKDRHVRRGPGRPVFSEEMRLLNVCSLDMVDYACIVDDETPFECIERIRPDVFAKGQDQKDRDARIHSKIFEEEKDIYKGAGEIYATSGISFSASRLVKNFTDVFSEETRSYLEKFRKKYPFEEIVEQLNGLDKMKVLLLGDGIIDEYNYCRPMGKSAKATLIVNKYLTHEIFAGGSFAIANHLAGLCKSVTLVATLGMEDSREEFVRANLKGNVEPKFFFRDDGPTVIKTRYIDSYLNQKLFEINRLNDTFINEEVEQNIIEWLTKEIPNYDLVLVSDFGHGLVTDRIIALVEKVAAKGKIAVNAQTNGANVGYNLITKYRHNGFICLDETEARLATQEKFADIELVGERLLSRIDTELLIITLGKKGSACFGKEENIVYTPILSSKVVDTVGAGDAFFSFSALCHAKGMPADFVSFIGNAVGALAVQIVGNKKPVEKFELLEFINAILK
jgi:rfaE bifunctional protein kinase chain/domain/rfaE bifunctional protein nucleotidyltransferase chain/domain